jgi:hypothetical protein
MTPPAQNDAFARTLMFGCVALVLPGLLVAVFVQSAYQRAVRRHAVTRARRVARRRAAVEVSS